MQFDIVLKLLRLRGRLYEFIFAHVEYFAWNVELLSFVLDQVSASELKITVIFEPAV